MVLGKEVGPLPERPEDASSSSGAARSSTSNHFDGQAEMSLQVGGNVTGGITITTGPSSSIRPRSADSLPVPAQSVVPRSELLDELIEALRDDDVPGTAPVVGVTGGSGFGKTTLAASVSRDDRAVALFPDGVLWVAVGQDAAGPDLANKINDLSGRLAGTRPSFTDPEKAGEHLGNLLADKRCLLVIDDVWRRAQLESFAAAGRRCRRLVTTRFPELLPEHATPVAVGAMRLDQAQAVLCAGWSTHHPDQVDPLLARTQSWPLLLVLANRAVRKYVSGGLSLSAAAQLVADRLSRGAEAVDRTTVTQRCDSAAAMVELSLSLLDAKYRQRCFDLAVFPGEAFISPETLRTYWGRSAGLTADTVTDLLARLDELALVQSCWVGKAPAVQLHDVVGDYLRERAGSELAEYHRTFLASFGREPAGEAGTGTEPELPESNAYLREHGSYHRRAADRPQTGVHLPVSTPLTPNAAQQRRTARSRRVRWTVLMVVSTIVVLSTGVALATRLETDRGERTPRPQPAPTKPAPPSSAAPAVPPPAPTPEPAPAPAPEQPAEQSVQQPAGCSLVDCDLPARRTARAANGSLVTLAQSPTGTVQRYVQSSAQAEPRLEGDLGGNVKYAPVVVADNTGKLVGLAIDASGKLLYNPNVDPQVPLDVVASSWETIADGVVGTPAAAQDSNGRLVVVAKSPDGALWRIHQTTSDGEWASKRPLGGPQIDGEPEIYRDRVSALRVFGLSRDHYVHTWAQRFDVDSFDDRQLGKIKLDTKPTAVLRSGRFHLLARDGEGALHQITELDGPGGLNQWQPEWSPAPEFPGQYTGMPIVATDESGAAIAFVRGKGAPNRVYYAVLGSGGSSEELAQEMNPMLSATLDENGAIAVQGWSEPRVWTVVSDSPTP